MNGKVNQSVKSKGTAPAPPTRAASPPRRSSFSDSLDMSPEAIIQRAEFDPSTLTYGAVMQLQRTIGNQAVGRLLRNIQDGTIQQKRDKSLARQLYQPDIDALGRAVEASLTQAENPQGGERTIQRTITIRNAGGGEEIFKEAGDVVEKYHRFIFEGVGARDEDDFYDALTKLSEDNAVFETLDDLKKRALQMIESEDSGSGGLWQEDELENEEMATNDLGQKHGVEIGDSIRNDPYVSVDKEAFEVKGNENQALIIRINRPPGAGPIWKEVARLKQFAEAKIPAAEIIDCGFYHLKGVKSPAILMKRYATGSKVLLRMQGGSVIFTENWEQNIKKYFEEAEQCENGIQSLHKIKSYLSHKKQGIDDIQFLIDHDGSFVINDANEMGAKYLDNNLELIGQLEIMLAARKNQFE